MKYKLSEQAKENIRVYTIAGILIATFCFLFMNGSPVFSFLKRVVKILTPFFIGFAIAFILMPLRNIIETRWLGGLSWKKKTKRTIAVISCIIIFLLLITVTLLMLIPQLISSVQTLVGNMDVYLRTLEDFVNRFQSNEEYSQVIDNILQSLFTQISTWMQQLSSLLPKVLNYSVSLISSVFNFFMGLIVSVYILLDEETFRSQIRKATKALFSEKTSKRIFYVAELTGKMFNSFIFGKALDSLIIGIICWFVTSIMKIPYSPLISFIIGITNMIPVFGPFIGAIPSAFILLVINPMAALEFVIFIIILQQIDGNIIGPYILGDSMGLPAFWIMFAIILGGGLFGVIGMFLGVPLFAVIFTIGKEILKEKLKIKEVREEK